MHRVERAAGVGDDEAGRPQALDDPDGKGHLIERIAFVIMEPAFHGRDGDAADRPQNHLPRVGGDGGFGKAGDFRIGNGDCVFDLPGDVAEAGAEDDACPDREIGLCADCLDRLVDALFEIFHECPFTGISQKETVYSMFTRKTITGP